MKKSLLKRVSNRCLHLIARFSPGGATLRPLLHRLRGVKIKGYVFIGEEVYLENEYPELIELHDGAQLALRCTIMCHFRDLGKVIIGKNAWIGPGCIIAASPGEIVSIGEGAVIAAGSVVTKSVSPFTFVGGVPDKTIAKTTIPMTVTTDFHEWKKGLTSL